MMMMPVGSLLRLLRAKPPHRATRVMTPAMTPRNEAMVMTATSRCATWDISWASTPSSSSGSSLRSRPVVAQTSAVRSLRPVAKAFGTSLRAIATRGLGMSARAQIRSIAPCSSGASCGVTSRAPIPKAAMRSLNQNWAMNRPPAMIRMIGQEPRRTARSTPTRTTYSSPIRNMVLTMRVVRPRSGA